MEENNIEANLDETKKRKKKRKHKKRLSSIERMETNIGESHKINNIFEEDLSVIEENKINYTTFNHEMMIKESNTSNCVTDSTTNDDNQNLSKKCGDFLSPNTFYQNSSSTSSMSRSTSLPQDVNSHDIPPTICSSAPNLADDRHSHSTESAVTMISVNRIYQPPTLKSHHSTFSMKIHKSDSCNESKLQTELKCELLKYFPDRKAKFMVITWNMAGISTYPELFLGLIENSNCDDMCDIYLLSFQETTSNKQELLSRIQMTFGGHYVIYNYIENGSLFSILVGHKKFIWNLAIIGRGSLSTRVTPITKGVAAISFQFFGNTILFLGSHFSSGKYESGDKGKNHLRIEDYNSIIYSKELIKSLTSPEMKLGPDEKNLTHYFDYTFWAGDLNFRILRDDVTVARLILTEIDQNDGVAFEELLEYDELINSQTAGLVFQEFEEGRIMFLPTYNFIFQTNEYNEKRTPSYTDRILFRSERSRGIECTHYNSVKSYTCSDHKPVCAVLEITIDPQYSEHLKSSGIFNKEIYTKCFDECEMKQKESMTTVPSRVCSIQ